MPVLRLFVWLILSAAVLAPARAAVPSSPAEVASAAKALERAAAAVVGVQARAVDGARSARSLGRTRAGSGIVIDGNGLVLTIGYLVLEAEHVLLTTDDRREVPARVVAYDQATGFGLVRALTPLRLEPAPLGQAQAVVDDQVLMVATGGDSGAVSAVKLASRRPFAGYWEYLVDDALFTTPPRTDHSGAGLFNERGELVGVGSLLVNDAAGAGRRLPGNMFVPIDLLQPVLPELLARGRSQRSERAWMGLNCVEVDGRIRVVRVTEDSPADVAGLEAGDQVLSIDGQRVSSVAALWQELWKGDSSQRAVTLSINRAGEARTVVVHTVDRAYTLRRAEGI